TVQDGADVVVDVDGALITPAFVDAHVHLLETGLALEGVDLSVEGGARDLAGALALVARAAGALGEGAVLLGHGWDETQWPERRAPTTRELDAAVGGRPAYLARTDVHSAVVSTALVRASGCDRYPGWSPRGVVTGEAHHRVREVARAVTPARRAALHRSALRAAAGAGIASVHELAGPWLDSPDGLRSVMEMTAARDCGLPLVVGMWAQACRTVEDAQDLLASFPGLAGIGGDLTVDGSIGSRTAALNAPYTDAPGTAGALQMEAGAIAAHVVAVTRVGTRSAFHAIGDRAVDELVRGLRLAEDELGPGGLRGAGHRVEHAEMSTSGTVGDLAALGVTVSAQPAFDVAWGGPDGMYARRLGDRWRRMNPYAELAAAGVPLAFGSDSPVTAFDPWAAVRGAVEHRAVQQRISARAAFRAHTRGGWRAAGL
ncbi:hydrolase, partial [Cellulomonas bogoriensis 69B4 = DSM 16987]